MKKQIISKLLLALITASLLLSGCGAEETDGSVETSQVEVEQEEEGKIEGIHVTEGAKYQYQVINPEDIIIEYSGLKSDIALSEYDGSYVTDTSVYLSDTVGVYLGEEHFEAKVSEYVHYTDVNFKWNVSDEDLYLLWRKDLEVSPSLFEGSITYADGYVGSIDADEVELKYDGYVIDVIITLRGDDRVGYQVEISEAWLDLNEERLLSKDEEEIAEWYEGLGGDSSQVEGSTAMKTHDDWNAINVDDLSDEEFSVQYNKMTQLYNAFRDARTNCNAEEIYNGIADGSIKAEGDIAFQYDLKEDSEWYVAFGESSLSEVFEAHGLPEYGVHGLCYCSKTSYEEAAQIAGMTVDEFESSFRQALQVVPLSPHERNTLSGEELLKYVRQYLINDNNDDDKLIVESESWAKVVGVSHEKVSSLYAKEKYGIEDTSMQNALNMYSVAKTNCGYEGDFVAWCNLSESEFDVWYVKVVNYLFECENWDNIKETYIRKYEALGGVTPEWVIYEDGHSVNPNI